MPREKSRSPEKVKKTSVTVKKVSTIERKGKIMVDNHGIPNQRPKLLIWNTFWVKEVI